jgi:hypothetical protein
MRWQPADESQQGFDARIFESRARLDNANLVMSRFDIATSREDLVDETSLIFGALPHEPSIG